MHALRSGLRTLLGVLKDDDSWHALGIDGIEQDVFPCHVLLDLRVIVQRPLFRFILNKGQVMIPHETNDRLWGVLQLRYLVFILLGNGEYITY
jgi:hypothetical protein